MIHNRHIPIRWMALASKSLRFVDEISCDSGDGGDFMKTTQTSKLNDHEESLLNNLFPIEVSILCI